MCLVPEDRKAQGVVLDAPIRVNVTMARLSTVVNRFGFIRRALEHKIVTDLGASLRPLRPHASRPPGFSLSGWQLKQKWSC